MNKTHQLDKQLFLFKKINKYSGRIAAVCEEWGVCYKLLISNGKKRQYK